MSVDVKKLKRPGKGTPPAPVETHNNLEKTPARNIVPLQLNIEHEIRREFRVYAAEHDVDMSNLFKTVWKFYKDAHG